ncbi:hypothetical protein MPTK1_8g09940 [Marchantia polymorpha subsp. ruderalis]|uniref:Uncharacterized protein n=1 Tax=Marchantia polymorpha TaxID=3197 RepID=A0A2R6XN01_MARPO|nr:hypothetical protein MARPO_0008s0228 [Marchantia polymorpha]BBN19351.1 hypothetical protein Mp_8g09940 [Marchantia polymorpha subsp. ruderalis]|eukprot:PTQ47482.1 hypothetical protein MARPO_0008s0228 [Marchantia polymorpha]
MMTVYRSIVPFLAGRALRPRPGKRTSFGQKASGEGSGVEENAGGGLAVASRLPDEDRPGIGSPPEEGGELGLAMVNGNRSRPGYPKGLRSRPTSQYLRGLLSPGFTVSSTSCTSTVGIQSTPHSKIQTGFIILLHRAAAASGRHMQSRERRWCLPHVTHSNVNGWLGPELILAKLESPIPSVYFSWLENLPGLIGLQVAAAAGPGPINSLHRTLLHLRLSDFSFSWKKLRLERVRTDLPLYG